MSKPTSHQSAQTHVDQSLVVGQDRLTLDALFVHPVPSDLQWGKVVGLFDTIGVVERRPGHEYAFRIADKDHVIHRTDDRNLAKSETKDLRRLLIRAGWSPDQHETVTGESTAAPNLLIAIAHNEARIYRVDVASHDPLQHVITPHDPHHYLHHLTHKDQDRDREQGQRAHEDASFYERIAQDVADASHIVVVGSGKGHSNAGHLFLKYLESHHRRSHGRAVIEVVADLSSLTAPQLLDLGRRALREPAV